MAQRIALLDSISALLGGDRFGVSRPGLYVCEPAWSWKPSMFTDFDFWMVFEGEGWMRINGATHALRPGAGFLIQPGDEVEAWHNPENPLTVFACHLNRGKTSSGTTGRLRNQVLRFNVRDPAFFRLLAEEAVQLGLRDQRSMLLTRLTVAQMIVRAFAIEEHSVSDASPTVINRLAMEIRSRPGHSWSTPEMARRCSWSVPQFNRRFRQVVGESPRQFVIHQRVRRAVQLLRESDMPIQRIAESLGYNDHFFFHRQFRKITQTTPGEVRNGAPINLHD